MTATADLCHRLRIDVYHIPCFLVLSKDLEDNDVLIVKTHNAASVRQFMNFLRELHTIASRLPHEHTDIITEAALSVDTFPIEEYTLVRATREQVTANLAEAVADLRRSLLRHGLTEMDVEKAAFCFPVTLVLSGDTSLIPCCLARQTGFRLASGLPAARVAARERGHAIQGRFGVERSPDAFGRSERGELVGVGLLLEEVHEAAGRAREEPGDVDEAVVASCEMRADARQRPILRALDEPRPDRVQRHIARRHQMVLVHDDGAEPRLEQVSGHPEPRIDESAVAPVRLTIPMRLLMPLTVRKDERGLMYINAHDA